MTCEHFISNNTFFHYTKLVRLATDLSKISFVLAHIHMKSSSSKCITMLVNTRYNVNTGYNSMVSCTIPFSIFFTWIQYNPIHHSPDEKNLLYHSFANLYFKGSKSPQSNASVPPEVFPQTGLGAAVGCITPVDQPGGGETTDCGARGDVSAAGACSCGC